MCFGNVRNAENLRRDIGRPVNQSASIADQLVSAFWGSRETISTGGFGFRTHSARSGDFADTRRGCTKVGRSVALLRGGPLNQSPRIDDQSVRISRRSREIHAAAGFLGMARVSDSR